MNKDKILKYGGIVGIVLGSGALYLSGAGEDTAMSLVGGAFVLFGIFSQILKK